MKRSLIDSSPASQRKPSKPVSSSTKLLEDEVIEAEESSEVSVTVQKRALALDMLQRGKGRREVADKLSLTEAEVFRIEEDYYSKQETLSEHAMLMKQLTRLEKLLDSVWDRVVDNNLMTDPDDLKSTLAIIDSISDLAGLKKTKVEAEIHLIQQQQVPVIVSYVDFVNAEMERHMKPLLTDEGRKELEANRETWLTEATQRGVSLLEEPTAEITM